VLFGRSGLEVTLIDYGLSRAKLPNGDIAYCDLEEDLAVFCGEDGNSQYDTYRRYVQSLHIQLAKY
jgi:serine/threonine-protein kinase haspin